MNEESNSLYEKLSKINEVKHEIKQAIVDMGGKDYINDDTLFEDYPDAIRNTHIDILNACAILEQIKNGSEAVPSVESDLSYSDVKPYLTDILKYREGIISYLNYNGVEATSKDTFEELIEKLPSVEDALRTRYLNRKY